MSGRENPLIAAVDVSEADAAVELAARLAGVVGMVKLGLEVFVAAGPDVVTRAREHSPVFLDLKLHDIPNTVGRAARNAGRLGISMLTVHSLGGPAMVTAAVEGAREGAESAGHEAPEVIAVTVLSSLGGESLALPSSLAFEAVEAGAAGVVVSGEDVKQVREVLGDGPTLVVPGVRPAGHSNDDHARVLTPREALERGADRLVIGRPITDAPDPAAAAGAILREVS